MNRRWKIVLPVMALAIVAAFFFSRQRVSRQSQSAAPWSSEQVVASSRPTNSSSMATSNTITEDALIDFAAALDAALQEADPRKRAIQFGTLLRQWWAHNPEAALAYVQKMSPSAEYTQGLLFVLENLGQKDSKRALTLARDMATTSEQRAIYNILFDQLARADIHNALDLLELVPVGESHDLALRSLTTVWAEQDLDALLQWAKDSTNTADKALAFETALSVLSNKDPRHAIDLAEQFLKDDVLNRVLADSLRNLTADDPLAASEIVSRLPAGSVQSAAALDIARALTQLSPEKALAWIKTLPAGDLQQLALNNALDIWGKKDPAGAKEYVLQMPPGADQDSAARHFGSQLAALDPMDAIQWAQTLTSDSARNAALVSITSGWAKTDPEAASRWAMTLDAESPARGESLRAALSYWALQDPSAAGSFVQTLPQVDQSSAAAMIAATYAQNNVADALTWAQSLPFDDGRQTALREIITRWADNQPQDAANWVMNEPDSNLKPEHVRTVLTDWFSHDEKAATTWAQTLQPGPSRDAAYNVLATQTTSQSPTTAIKWAQGIGAPDLRETRLEQVAIAWLQSDRAAARTWITASELSPETKNRLLQQ